MEYEVQSSGTFSAKQLNDAYYKMLLHLTDEMSVKQVVDYLSNLLSSTVVLYTHSGNHIFSSCEDSRSRKSLLRLQFQLSISDTLDNYFERERTSHTETSDPGVYLDHYAASNSYALSGDLSGPGGPLGTLCLLDVNFDNLDEQTETFKLFCRILSQKLCQSNYQESESMERMDINSGAKWFRKIKGDTFQNFYIAVISAKDISDWQTKLFKAELERNHHLFRMVIQEEFIIVLLNIRDNDEATIMRTTMEQFAQIQQVSIGLSYRFQGTEKIHDSFLQAVDVLNIAHHLKLSDHLFRFEQFAVDILLFDLMRTSSLDCYRNEALDTLCIYDKQNSTQYYGTLKCYISCGSSKQKASQALYIHRNTLSYRLERIGELLNVDLSDTDVQTRLYLDIKVREMLEACTN